MILCWVSFASFFSATTAWPGMRPKNREGEDYIGPSCTVGAHNWHPESGPCPNMEQPPPPTPASGHSHVWPNQFIVDWKFYFVPDDSDAPPYDPLPTTPYNVTLGRTYYYNNEETGERNMKEVYDQYCIPVFGAPLTPMGRWNKYSCDFLNVGTTNTSYVVLHEDRPPGAPECCIIGRPFHAPPPNFSTLMPIASTSPVGSTMVDWFSVYDKYSAPSPPPPPIMTRLTFSSFARDAGVFSYGFETDSASTPYAFYMKGVPWVANWMWQKFDNFRDEFPEASVWDIPPSCNAAEACPGW